MTTVPTWTAALLVSVSVVTTAVRLPAAVGFVQNVTVSEVARRRGDGADRAVIEDDRVMGRGRIEAKAVNHHD